ncbi:MAG TPA: hypothetical protein ENO24_09450, partial [Chloroflexi bacterium]|nr:hypothetical protein [Chloroflexota bacterium]
MERKAKFNGEEGQAAVFITILLMFALIGLTALAIDGGHLYVVRRDLQNMADAACLAAATELTLGGDNAAAYQSAVDYVLANGGGEELYTPLEGNGDGLFKGITVTDAGIRVALVTEVPTYFTMIFNRTGAGVSARAHCNAVAAGGLLPIAVRRYQYNEEDETQQLDLLANKNCQPPGCYYHGPEGAYVEDTWDGRYGPMSIWLPVNAPSMGELHDQQTGNIDWDASNPEDGIYEGACVLGDGVSTNDGTSDYKGFVLLDIRNLVPGPVEYLSGATGQSNTNKEISRHWLCEGYGNIPPLVGDQLAMLDGVSNDFAAQEMATCWEVGQEFVAVVYSGYVWSIPDLGLTIAPSVNQDDPVFPSVSSPVTYTVTLEKTGPSPWDEDAVFQLTSEFLEEPTEPITPTVVFDPSSVVILPRGANSASVDMVIYAANPITTTSYLSALTVKAEEQTGVGVRRWGSANFRYGDPGADFTLYAAEGQVNVPQDGTVDIYLTTTSFGGLDENKVPVTASIVAPAGTVWGTVFTSGQSDEIKRIRGVSQDRFTLKVRADAPASEPGIPYTVRFTIGPAAGRYHTVDVVVNVHTPRPG